MGEIGEERLAWLGVESAPMRVLGRERDIERLLVRAPILALFVAACAANPSPAGAQGDPVSLYMQNLTSEPIEFTMRPVGDPAQIFGVDSGKVVAACVEVPANWQLAQTEAGKPPGEGAVLRVRGAPEAVKRLSEQFGRSGINQ